jgi:RimJ/RimL family protein N-acetyltransferase
MEFRHFVGNRAKIFYCALLPDSEWGMNFMVVDTIRLQLRPFAPEPVLALLDNPTQFADLSAHQPADGLLDFYNSGEISPDFIAKIRACRGPDPWVLGFAVTERQSGQVIGAAGFKGPPDAEGMVEIAYAIVHGCQGRGYATEAASALVTFAFDDHRVTLVRAHTLPEPNASTRVLTKCGFAFVGDVVDPDDGPVWRWERTRPSA